MALLTELALLPSAPFVAPFSLLAAEFTSLAAPDTAPAAELVLLAALLTSLRIPADELPDAALLPAAPPVAMLDAADIFPLLEL